MPEPTPRPDLPDVTLTITADTSDFENGVKDAHITTLRVALAMAEQRAEQAEAAVQRGRDALAKWDQSRKDPDDLLFLIDDLRAALDPKDTP